MIEPKVLYFCDHKIEVGDGDVKLTTIVRSGTSVDIISTTALIYEIESIYDLSNNQQHTYYQDYDFTINDDRRSITWLGTSPSEGDSYSVEYRHSAESIVQLELEACTKCEGRGWYLSLFENNERIVKSTSGFEKLVQEFIKLLLSENSDGYGSKLHTLLGEAVKNESELSTNVMSIVYDCEVQYKAIQSGSIAHGLNMDNTELLKTVSVLDVSFDPDLYSISLSIKIYNEAGNSAAANLFL